MTIKYNVELSLHDELNPEGILFHQPVAEFPVTWDKEKETLGGAIWKAFQMDTNQSYEIYETEYLQWEVFAEFWNNGDGAMIIRSERGHVCSVAVNYDDAE